MRAHGYSLMNLILTLFLVSALITGLIALWRVQEQRQRVSATVDVVHRAAARTREIAMNQSDGYASVVVSQIADIVPPNQRTPTTGAATSLRTALNRPLSIVADGSYGFWVRLSALNVAECRAVLRQVWTTYPRVRVNGTVLKSGMSSTLGDAQFAQCVGASISIDVEGS
ncbi:hypothetical protein C7S18_23585 (plasmid) [Ahniella affigens]|uniref:Type 4 secretion system PilS N-terminal domain-containing protein n=1 Tax=Ahniella affigens TaxID=2021234 RepID=A0A2P1PZK9_9GAMM|nr:hypothetical protein [Ahniella affigens]AVQ00282.1 hypothetical protein C7S18_23585 [Ahniella affigens]